MFVYSNFFLYLCNNKQLKQFTTMKKIFILTSQLFSEDTDSVDVYPHATEDGAKKHLETIVEHHKKNFRNMYDDDCFESGRCSIESFHNGVSIISNIDWYEVMISYCEKEVGE